MFRVDPYLSAEALGITEDERSGLIGLMRDFSHGNAPEWFNMLYCSRCICGSLDIRLGRENSWGEPRPDNLRRLYLGQAPYWLSNPLFDQITNTPAEAAVAIHKFLTVPA